MRLTSDRLLFRTPDPADADALFAIFGDPNTNAFNPSGPYPNREKAVTVLDGWLRHWQQHGFGTWAIAERTDPDDVIGFGGVTWRNYGEGDELNLGYRFAQRAWGRGYATEMAQFALADAFTSHRLSEIGAIVRPLNIASIRVLEKIGMRRRGELDDVPGEAKSLRYFIDRVMYEAGAMTSGVSSGG